MLALELRLKDKIYIGENIIVEWSKISIDNKTNKPLIRLAFDAPRDIIIDREYIYLARHRGLGDAS